MLKVEADMRQIEELADKLDRFAAKGVPHAIRNSLNRSAFAGRKIWQREIDKSFTLRNQFTRRSIRVDKARGISVLGMEAVLGSVAPYMEDREHGETKTSRGKHGVPIPTTEARGSKTRLVKRPNRMGNIRLGRKAKGRSRRQRNAIAISMARKSNNKFVFLDVKRGPALFRFKGGRKNFAVRKMWDLSRRSVSVKPMPTLQPTLRRLGPVMDKIHIGALKEQLKRHRILR